MGLLWGRSTFGTLWHSSNPVFFSSLVWPGAATKEDINLRGQIRCRWRILTKPVMLLVKSLPLPTWLTIASPSRKCGRIWRNPSLLLIFSFLSGGYMTDSWKYLLIFYLFTDSHNLSSINLIELWGFLGKGIEEKKDMLWDHKENHIQK